jgi:hypothetical protein
MKTICKLLRFGVPIFSILSIFIFSCSRSGKKAFEQGNYYEAVQQATAKLQKDARNESAAETLPQAYSLAIEQFSRDIQATKNSNQQFRWESILDNYLKINELYQKIQECNACRRLVPNAQNFRNEEDEARENAASERYAAGIDLMKLRNRDAAKQAFGHFERLKQFAPNFNDIDARLEESLSAGSIHVVLEPAAVNSRLYQYSNSYFQQRISDFLRTSRKVNKFVRFYSPQEATNVKLSPNQIVKLEFIDFVVGETNTDSNTQTVMSKDSVNVGEATIDGKKVAVRGKVNAQLTKFHRAVRSRGILAMDIVDFQSKNIISHEEIPGEFVWINDWAKYNGDERALSDADKNLCKNTEQLPPPREQLFIEFCKPIYDQFTSRVKRFYDKY